MVACGFTLDMRSIKTMPSIPKLHAYTTCHHNVHMSISGRSTLLYSRDPLQNPRMAVSKFDSVNIDTPLSLMLIHKKRGGHNKIMESLYLSYAPLVCLVSLFNSYFLISSLIE